VDWIGLAHNLHFYRSFVISSLTMEPSWLCNKATILPMEKSNLIETEKGETGKEQSQEHAHHFLWHQGD
jgi:hypothetical protein